MKKRLRWWYTIIMKTKWSRCIVQNRYELKCNSNIFCKYHLTCCWISGLVVFGFLDRIIKWFRHSKTWRPPSLRSPFSLKTALICLAIIKMQWEDIRNGNVPQFRGYSFCKLYIVHDIMFHLYIEIGYVLCIYSSLLMFCIESQN